MNFSSFEANSSLKSKQVSLSFALLNAGLVISGQKVPHPIDKYSTTFRFYVIYMYLLTFCFDNTIVHFDLLQKSFTNIYHYVVCHFMSNFNF